MPWGPMTIMWCDPGKGSGLAWCRIAEPTRAAVVASVLDGSGGVRHVTGPTEDHRAWRIFEAVMRVKPDVFGMEDFILYPDRTHLPSRSGTEPMRIIAKVEMLLWLARTQGTFVSEWAGPFDVTEMKDERQMANERLVVSMEEVRSLGLYFTDGQMKKNGWGEKSKDAMAALQHLLAYVKKLNEAKRKGRG